MDEYALIGTSTESSSKSVSLDGARRMALRNIEAFVLSFSDQQTFAVAAASSAPAALAQVTERARIQEAGHLRCRFCFTQLKYALFCCLDFRLLDFVFVSLVELKLDAL